MLIRNILLRGVFAFLFSAGFLAVHASPYTIYTLPANADVVSLAIGGDGNVWFANCAESKIGKIVPNTATPSQWSLPNSNSCPFEIIVDANGMVWFTELYSNKIGRLDPKNGQIAEWSIPTANASPTGIAIGKDGMVWFTEQGGNKIGRLDPQKGSFQEWPLPTANAWPSKIVSGPDGTLWFLEKNASKIGRIHNVTGQISEWSVPTAYAGLYDLVVDTSRGVIWFSEFNKSKIGKFKLANQGIEEFASTGIPTAIIMGLDGRVWYRNTSGGLVEYDPESGASNAFLVALGTSELTTIRMDSKGLIWYNDRKYNHIVSLRFEPAIRALEPSSGSVLGGESITIQGKNFADATKVLFGTSTASFEILSPTQIRATIPPGAQGVVNVTVVDDLGVSYLTKPFTYEKAPQSIRFPPPVTPTYGDADWDPGIPASSGLPIQLQSENPAVATITAGGKIHWVGAGTAIIRATQAGDERYLAAEEVSQTLVVSPKNIQVLVHEKLKTYGAPDPELTYESTPLVGTDQFSGSLQRIVGEDVGTYEIVQGSLDAGTNYVLKYQGNTLTIQKKIVRISGFQVLDKVYDGTVQAQIQYEGLEGVLPEEKLTLQVGAATFVSKSVGSKRNVSIASFALLGEKSGNYDLQIPTGPFLANITPKPVVIQADAQAKVYGELDPDLTYSQSGFLDNDVAIGKLTRVGGTVPGKYEITQGTLNVGANYRMEYTGSQLEVLPKPVRIQGVLVASKVYDGLVSASVNGGYLSEVLPGDSVGFELGDAEYADPEVGNNKPVRLIGAKLKGKDAGSYSLQEVTDLTSEILARDIIVKFEEAKVIQVRFGSIQKSNGDNVLVAWAAAQDAGVDTIRGVWKGILADSSQLYITIKKQLVLQDPTTIHFAPIDWANLVGNGTTGVDLRSPRVSVEKQISVEVSQGLAQAVYGNSSPYLGVFTGKLCEHSCLNALVKAPGDLKIQVSIFDHMGVLVLSWSQLFGGKELRKLETTRDGRKLIPIAWNLRARNGAPVVSGIYLWKFLIQPKEGAQLEVIRRVGVQ